MVKKRRFMKQHQFRKLLIWQRAMKYITLIYQITSAFPKSELYGLTDQIRRAAVSIALNIAEGSGTNTKNEFQHFLSFSKRSVYEVITGLEISIQLGYGSKEIINAAIIEGEEIVCMIVGFTKQI
jgi:four helix bundle protein